MNDTPFQDFPSYIQKPSKKPKFVPIFLGAFVVVIIALAVLYVIGGTSKQEAQQVAPIPTQAVNSPTPIATDTASLTPLPSSTEKEATSKQKVERSDLRIAILNGSGIAGAAKQTSSHLNSLGYKIVTIGNAEEFSYKGITIKIKKAKSAYLTLLKKDVADGASKSATIETSVDDSIATDAEVIVGK